MSADDYDIEYLDEDADLVQQCVNLPVIPTDSERGSQFLVEIPNKKRKVSEVAVPSSKKKKPAPAKQSNVKPKTSALNNSLTTKEKQIPPKSKEMIETTIRRPSAPALRRDLVQRKLLNIKIPDYDDPLCLPVVALRHSDHDAYRLNNWNKLCLEKFKDSDLMLRPNGKEPSVSSTKEITFQVALNKFTGRLETDIKGKIVAKSQSGLEMPFTFETLLPVYREKTTLRNFSLRTNKSINKVKNNQEVLLTKEVDKDEETLVVYKPNEKISAVYEFVKQEIDQRENKDDAPKRCLKEMTVCRICAPCYQTSWRGSRVMEKRKLRCKICSRSFVSVYSLLAHMKTHDSADVKKYKKTISALLATIVDYHYKCRICQEVFSSIKVLRRHVVKHKGAEQFLCEVGQHTTY